jgi:hypothetical protein
MKSRYIRVAALLALASFGLDAAELPADAGAAMAKVGVPVYPGAAYCMGDIANGLFFGTSDPPEAVHAWYREALPGWTLVDIYGSQALVEAKAARTLPEVMTNNHVIVSGNDDPCYGLAADMTTEIAVGLPKIPPDSGGGAVLAIPPGRMPSHSEAVGEITPFEVTGSLGSGEDMEFGLGRYFYIQDEDFREYPVVYEDGLSSELSNRLSTIVGAYAKVRLKGNLVVLQDGRPLGFDRSVPIEIHEVK